MAYPSSADGEVKPRKLLAKSQTQNLWLNKEIQCRSPPDAVKLSFCLQDHTLASQMSKKKMSLRTAMPYKAFNLSAHTRARKLPCLKRCKK